MKQKSFWNPPWKPAAYFLGTMMVVWMIGIPLTSLVILIMFWLLMRTHGRPKHKRKGASS